MKYDAYRVPGYTIGYKAINEASIEFRVLEITAMEDGVNPVYGELDNPIKDPYSAPAFMHGFIKWDSCSNWYFDVQNDGMIHFCGLGDALVLSKLFEAMYEIADEVIGLDPELKY